MSVMYQTNMLSTTKMGACMKEGEGEGEGAENLDGAMTSAHSACAGQVELRGL